MRRSIGLSRPLVGRPSARPPSRTSGSPPTRKSPSKSVRPNVWFDARKNLSLKSSISTVDDDCANNPKPLKFSTDIVKTDEIIVPVPTYSTPHSTPPRRVVSLDTDPRPLRNEEPYLEAGAETSDMSPPVLRRLTFETSLTDVSKDYSSGTFLTDSQIHESDQLAIQIKSDMMVKILNATWTIEENNLRVNEILRLLIASQKEITSRMETEYENMMSINVINAQKLLTMYTKLLSFIMTEIRLFESY